MDTSAINILFTRSVPHILEKIFFSLDYESYKTCSEVSKNWQEVIESKPYQIREFYVFDEAIYEPQENLRRFARYGNATKLKELLSSGELLNINCRTGVLRTTPLHLAAEYGHKDVVKILLEAEAIVEKVDTYGWTPLQRALSNGHNDVVKVLLNKGANPNANDVLGPKLGSWLKN